MGANFGIAGLDWQQRVNWDRLREYRIEPVSYTHLTLPTILRV